VDRVVGPENPSQPYTSRLTPVSSRRGRAIFPSSLTRGDQLSEPSRRTPLLATESPTDGAADRQATIRETEPLQALVTAMQAGKSVDFRASHDVAGRMAKAADEGWKKAALAHIGRATTPRES
jgi:hypothetical protein